MFRSLLSAVSGLFCVAGGLYLLTSQAVGQDSYIELIAHGMGLYFIGKGLFVWLSLAQQRDQSELLWDSRFDAEDQEQPATNSK